MFKLNIECSKDFEELHIKFKDGTSISTGPEDPGNSRETEESHESSETPERREPRKHPSHYLDTGAEFGGIPESAQNEVVRPPDITQDKDDRKPNVADELQNLDI